MNKFSLIIPVYNVESYLANCLDSCLNQDIPHSDYEIIVVNDGSPDNSQSIIDKYVNKYDNIIPIIKENGGLSSARNAGLDIAKGEYIWFIDSDDEIQKNCLGGIIEKIVSCNSDIATINYKLLDIHGCELKKVNRKMYDGRIYSGTDLFFNHYIYPFSGAPFYIFKRQFLIDNDLRFKEGIYFEDCLFTPILYTKINSCICYDKEVYFYYMRDNSITHSKPSIKKCNDNIIIAELLYKNLQNCPDDRKCILYKMVAHMIKQLFVNWKGLNYKDKVVVCERFFNLDIWQIAIKKSRQYKYWLIICIFWIVYKIK